MITTTTTTTCMFTTITTSMCLPIWSWIVTVLTIGYTILITFTFQFIVMRVWGCTTATTTFTTESTVTTVTITTTTTGPPITRS
tara:strand:+ start:307 stop:558 length:252 start_codon:yes stop_codon:yes gene_type:complete